MLAALRRLRAPFFFVASLALAAPIGCGKDSSGGPPVPEVLAPLPAPAGLVAEVFVPKPNVLWGKLREVAGGPARLLPPTFSVMVSSMLNLPAGASELIDNDVPAVGAVSSDGTTELAVMALHVRDGGKVVAALTQAPDARFLARPDAPSRVTLIEPKPGQTALAASIGVCGNYLLLGYAPDALLKLGPYATRTVATHAMPTEDAMLLSTNAALAGPVKQRISTWWSTTKKQLEELDEAERKRHGGSAPTFGDPRAAVGRADAAFQSLFMLMGDLAEARVTLVVDDAGGHVRTTLKPLSKDGPAQAELAAMVTGSAEPLLDLPEDVTLAVMTRDSVAIRTKSATDQLDATDKLFAGKLAEADKQKLSDLLGLWAKGRGDWLAAGASIQGDRRFLYARSAIADEAMIEKGVKTTLGLASVPAFAEPLKHWLGELKLGSPSALGDMPGSLVKVERVPPPREEARPTREDRDPKETTGKKDKDKDKKKDAKKREPERFEIAWSLEKGLGAFVAASSAKDAMRELGRAKDAGLRGDPEVKKALEALGNEVSFALLVLPMRTVAGLTIKKPLPQKPPAAPVLVSFGKTPQDGWFRLDAATAALREIAKVRGLD